MRVKRKANGKRGAVLAVILLLWALAVGFVLWRTLSSPAGANGTPRPVYRVDTGEKKLALTFNAAWDDAFLDGLLSLLKAENVRATFFFVGAFAERYPEAVRKIVNAGHEPGNHSMTHPDLSRAPAETVLSEIMSCGDTLERLTGVRPTLFRAPSGAWTGETVRLAREAGLTTVQWSADSVDWKDPSPETIEARILKKASPGGILLFHVGKENTLKALPGILSALKAEGYSFVSVSDLLLEGETFVDAEGVQRRAN